MLWLDETKLVAQDVSNPDTPGPYELESSWDSPSAVSEDSSQQTPHLSASIPRFPWGTPLAAGQRSPTDRFMISSLKWPLSDRGEAYLFRHFVEKLAVWVKYPKFQTTRLPTPFFSAFLSLFLLSFFFFGTFSGYNRPSLLTNLVLTLCH